MPVKLNSASFDYAKNLIDEGKYVLDDRDDWSEHQPSAEDENRYIEQHGFEKYSRWFLGVDVDEDPDTKAHYKFPYGDFKKVHRCGLLAAETRAAQRKYTDIDLAAHQLHEMLDELRTRT
jgi:hypothetical protein